jgi:hypothetical protein
MKQLLAALTIIALSYSAASFAEQPPAPMGGMQHEGMQGGMQHGGGGMMHHGGGMAMDEQHVQLMQEHILKMHELSTQILAEKDPAKKEQLKQQQRDVMKAHHAGMMGGHGGMK